MTVHTLAAEAADVSNKNTNLYSKLLERMRHQKANWSSSDACCA